MIFIVDIRNIADKADIKPAEFQIRTDHVKHIEASRVPDMGAVIDRDPAGVHPDRLCLPGEQILLFCRLDRIINLHGYLNREIVVILTFRCVRMPVFDSSVLDAPQQPGDIVHDRIADVAVV